MKKNDGLNDSGHYFDMNAPQGLELAKMHLIHSLISQPKMRRRNGVCYFTVRRWRASEKPLQINLVRNIKQNRPELLMDLAGKEIISVANQIIGTKCIDAVTSIPSSHPKKKSLSKLIGQQTAKLIQKPYIEAFNPINARWNSSHPKNNIHREKITLKHPLNGYILLVDDIATSGSHIEEAVKLLRPKAELIISIAWIGQ